MSRISVEGTRSRGGFTLLEMLIAGSLAAIVVAAVLSASLFMGRNLTRLVNVQDQEVEGRRALRYFTDDVSAAISITVGTTTTLTLIKPTAASTTNVSYVYSALNGTLTRSDLAGARTLLSGLTSFSFAYFNESGDQIASSPQSIKAVEFVASSAAGSEAAGTRARYTTASPRVVVRNKQVLE
jgi:hypothetical protein